MYLSLLSGVDAETGRQSVVSFVRSVNDAFRDPPTHVLLLQMAALVAGGSRQRIHKRSYDNLKTYPIGQNLKIFSVNSPPRIVNGGGANDGEQMTGPGPSFLPGSQF